MDPFHNLFQTVGNAVTGAVQQGTSDLGTVLQNAKNTIMKIGDTAATQAAQEPDPAKKAQLHAVASDAYGTVAPSLGASPTSGASAQPAPQPAPQPTSSLPVQQVQQALGNKPTPLATPLAGSQPMTPMLSDKNNPDAVNPVAGIYNPIADIYNNAVARTANNPQAKGNLGMSVQDAVKDTTGMATDAGTTMAAPIVNPYIDLTNKVLQNLHTQEVNHPSKGNIGQAFSNVTTAIKQSATTPEAANAFLTTMLAGDPGELLAVPGAVKGMTQDAIQTVKDSIETAKTMPGGLQRGSISWGNDASEPNPEAFTDDKGNPLFKSNAGYEYPGGSKFTSPQPPGEFMPGNTTPVNPSGEVQDVNNRESFQRTAPPSNTPSGDQPPISSEESLPGGDPRKTSRRAYDILDNTFTVPAKKAMGALQKTQTYQGMIAHMKSGMDPGLLEQMPGLVSDSETGLLPKMIREVASNVKEPIPLKDPGAAAKNIMDDHPLFISDEGAAKLQKEITRALPKSADGKTVSAEDAIHYARELESKAAEIKGGDTYLTSHGDKRYLAQAMNSAADDVWDQIGKYVKPEDLERVRTPERMAYLKSLSPRLEAQVAAAPDIPKLRTASRDFVRMGQIIDQTDASSGTVFGKVGRAALGTSKVSKVIKGVGLAVKATHNPIGAAADVAKMGEEAAASSSENSPRAQLLNALQDESEGPSAHFADGSSPIKGGPPGGGEPGKSGNGGIGKGKKMLGVAGLGVLGTGLLGGAYMLGQHNETQSNAEGKDATYNPQQNHGDSIGLYDPKVNSVGKIPQSMGQMSQNSDGTYQMTNIYNLKDSNNNSLFVDPTTAKQEQQKLDEAENSVEYKNAPNGAYHIAIDKQQALLNTQVSFNNNTKVGNSTAIDAYTKVAGISQAAMTAVDQLNKYAPALGNVSKTYNEWQQISGGQYNALIEQLKTLQSYGIPIPDTTRFTATGLASALIQAQGQAVQNFHTDLSASLGYTGDQTTNNVQQTNAIPSTPPPATIPGQSTLGAPGMFGSQFFNNQ